MKTAETTTTTTPATTCADRFFFAGCSRGTVFVRAIFCLQTIALGFATLYLTHKVDGSFKCMVQNPNYTSPSEYNRQVDEDEPGEGFGPHSSSSGSSDHAYIVSPTGHTPVFHSVTVKAWLYVYSFTSLLYLVNIPLMIFFSGWCGIGPSPYKNPTAYAKRRELFKKPAACGYAFYALLVLFRVFWAVVGTQLVMDTTPCAHLSPGMAPALGVIGLLILFCEFFYELTVFCFGGAMAKREIRSEVERADKLHKKELQSISTWGYARCNLGHDLESPPEDEQDKKNIFVCVRCDEALNYAADEKKKKCPQPGCEDYYVCHACWVSGKTWTEGGASDFCSVNKNPAASSIGAREEGPLLTRSNKKSEWQSDKIKAKEEQEKKERERQREQYRTRNNARDGQAVAEGVGAGLELCQCVCLCM